MGGASLRKIAVVLGISRNTVRRHVRRATHGSGFPPPLDATPAWRTRAREIVAMHGPVMATILAATLRGEGFTVSARSVQRELACLRLERATALDAVARADAFCTQWTQLEQGLAEEQRRVS
jgi:predicted transcriptional regulator